MTSQDSSSGRAGENPGPARGASAIIPGESPGKIQVEVRHPERGPIARFVKRCVEAAATSLVSPRLIAYFLVRAARGDRAMLGASESLARIPGMRGVYLRAAFYRHTLAHFGRDVSVGWGSTFSMRQARVGEGTYIGRHCGIGFGDLGAHVMLADGVQVLSGGREHGLSPNDSETHQDQVQRYTRVKIGDGAWLGTNSVVMADVGTNAVIGAGAVVTRPVPDDVIAVGAPARIVKRLSRSPGTGTGGEDGTSR